MKKVTFFLFAFLFVSFSLAQEKFTTEQLTGSKTNMTDKWESLKYYPDGTEAIFLDDMNGDNTVAGIQARGWYFDDVDGAGTTTTFQGNTTVFNAYEGPATGYLGENYNGAFGGGLLIDQWLISPAITVSPGDTLKFWHRSPDGSTWADPLEVWLSSTAGTTHADFDVQVASFNGSTSGWAQYKGVITLSGTIRFAVRYYTTTGGPGGTTSDYVGLDYFEVVSGVICPVQTPVNPTPADNATGVAISGVTLNWSNSSGTAPTQVEVRFGLQNNMATVYSGAPVTSWSVPGPLQYNKTYQWQVINKLDTCNNSATWLFTTMEDPALVTIFYDDFSAGTGLWTITDDGSSATCVWTIHQASEYTLPPTAAGNVLAADPDACGSGSQSNTTATVTNHIDATNFASVQLEFDNDWQALVATDFGYVEVSTNNEADWTAVKTFDEVDIRNTHEVIDISSYVAGTSFSLRFRSVQPGWHWWWAIDNVKVIAWDVIPVELTSFAATSDNNNVNLNWSTATELNNSGFQIERSINGVDFQNMGFVAGHGTTTDIQNYSYVDQNVAAGKYSYRLKQVDLDGSFEYSKVVEVEVIGVREFALGQNYPNPFNPSTKISFSLAVDSKVSLKVFDVLGQEVAVLLNGQLSAGSQEVNFNAGSLNSGVYFYRIDADGIDGQKYSSVKKMILTK